MGDEPDPALLEPFMQAARELPAIDTTLQEKKGRNGFVFDGWRKSIGRPDRLGEP